MQTFTIRGPQDVDTLVRQTLHFAPKDSFVVVPIGDGPFARIDFGPADDMAEALTGALCYWRKIRVIVALYGDATEPIDVKRILPGVEVILVVDLPNPRENDLTRDDLAVLTEHAETVAEAERAACDAYEAGDGALAWTYLDRAEALGGMTLIGKTLALMIRNAVDPRQ